MQADFSTAVSLVSLLATLFFALRLIRMDSQRTGDSQGASRKEVEAMDKRLQVVEGHTQTPETRQANSRLEDLRFLTIERRVDDAEVRLDKLEAIKGTVDEILTHVKRGSNNR